MNKVPSPTEDLIEELKDTEFKKEYGAEQAKLEFAIVLRDARTQAKLTQQQLAGLLGRTQPYIARLEGGEANPTLAVIGRMLATLDLRIIIETAPIKPELETVPAVVYVASSSIPLMFVNAFGDFTLVDEKHAQQIMTYGWTTELARRTYGVESASTNSPKLSVTATV